MSSKPKTDPVDVIANKVGIGGYKRHLILCTGDKCCSEEAGLALWKHTKAKMQTLGLTNGSVFRTKASCLRICRDGPIAVVYPEGTWYRQLDNAKMDRIIDEHLIEGRPVKEYSFAANPLG